MSEIRYTNQQIQDYMSHLRKLGTYNEDQIKAYEQHLQDNYGENAIGAAADHPEEVDLYKDREKERVLTSFSDPKTAAEMLLKAGFKNPTYNKDGKLVAQDLVGRYVTDETNFWPKPKEWASQDLEHWVKSASPIRWLEANSGKAFPTLGQMLGGGLTGAAGFAGSGGNPWATYLASIPGAGAGAALGEKARQAIGESLDVYHPENGFSSRQLNDEATAGAEGEAIGRAVGKIPLPSQWAKWKSIPYFPKEWNANVDTAVSKIAAIPSWLMMGRAVPFADVARNIARPQEVNMVGDRGYGLRAAQKMESELEGAVRSAKADVSKIQDDFRSQQSGKPITGQAKTMLDKAIEDSLKFLDRHKQNRLRDSRIGPDEWNEIAKDTLRMHMGSGDELLTMAQRLSEDQPVTAYTGSISQRSEVAKSQQKKMSGQIKAALHQLSPELAAGDENFHRIINTAKTLRPIEGENQEAVVNTLWNKNNTARQQAAEELTPKTYNNELRNLKSYQAFDKAGALGETQKEQAARSVLALLLGTGTYGAHHTVGEAAALATAFLAATSPKTHYWMGKAVGSRALPTTGYFLNQDPFTGPWATNKSEKEPKP